MKIHPPLTRGDTIPGPQRSRHGHYLCTAFGRMLCAGLLGFVLIAPAAAAPTLTLANGVSNPPPNLTTTALNPPQTAVALTATLVQEANVNNLLQSVLTAQGFTNANNWTLTPNVVTLANNATFNITAYNLFLNPGGNNQPGLPNGTAAGSAFGETMQFTLNPNLAGPANPPAGSTVTEHWLQYINTNAKVNGYGFQIAGQQGFWQLDNGQVNGGLAAGAGTGPYYDSNADAGFSVPPTFSDMPQFYSGVGTYLDFTVIPVWDVFTPAANGNPATESIDVANVGLQWGFSIVPEPTTALFGVAIMGACAMSRRRKQATA
jgi:hypothetical protein